jgi:hypothetical protein
MIRCFQIDTFNILVRPFLFIQHEQQNSQNFIHNLASIRCGWNTACIGGSAWGRVYSAIGKLDPGIAETSTSEKSDADAAVRVAIIRIATYDNSAAS